MRRAFLFLSVAAGLALLPAPASAQDGDQHRHGRGESSDSGGRQHGGSHQEGQARQQTQQQRSQNVARPERVQAPAAVAPQASEWQGDRNNPRMEQARRRYEQLERSNARNFGTPQQTREVVERQRAEAQARGDRGNWNGNRGNRDGNWSGNRDNRGGNWNGNRDNRGGNWAQGQRRNWNSNWRGDQRYDWQRFRNTNRFAFHLQPYYSPYRGYGYNRFGIGSILDSLFFGRNYWIVDPWTWRLPPAEPGLQWVRYYNDVLLVDVYSGEVVDVIYDFFW
jgi:Nickel/cobalt transporter regulator